MLPPLTLEREMLSVSHSSNRLLASLPPDDFRLLEAHLQHVELIQSDVLVEGGEAIEQVYFPHSGIISLVVRLEQGATVEVAMVGSDGLFGAFSALDGAISLNTAIVQLYGTASTIDPTHLRAAADQSPSFRALLMRHEQVIFAQALQAAACNASHTVQERLSRWLLRARDLSGSNTLSFTQEFLAQMLGSQRNSVSVVANVLQHEGIISYHRGKIEIIDAKRLTDSCCECYEMVNGYYRKLIFDHNN